MYYIYTLLDPITGDVRYVGQTQRVKNRISQHLNKSHNLSVRLWVKLLSQYELKPDWRVFATAETKETSNRLEREYVAIHPKCFNHYLQGEDPYNCEGFDMSKERLSLEASLKKKHEDLNEIVPIEVALINDLRTAKVLSTRECAEGYSILKRDMYSVLCSMENEGIVTRIPKVSKYKTEWMLAESIIPSTN
jgi:hypothetical protein